ncbi:alpha-ketoglutarate-dependent dioxygenase AlkB [Sphingomonas sp.]|jgi:alkylated DNA repair dioxygenase AlkB|uniref:alpha-ketoglutarate-dependent dioxygenase AlkB n=1 Tax=Sphingomonas sp. TaxID=28214 RepID=UPI002E329E98|nr:alpha-ketoglutarate-dependent dioxygenase AlkB [Sphingomonas sp.]HEX4693093.1 alpha-ketoglutarate-dependent dioxygenase AlkB [Sphingomonas sp.]
MTAQFDLFGAAKADLPSGLAYREGILSTDEEAALLVELTNVSVAPFRFQGWVGKRQTASFGWHYDFDTAKFGEADPIPDFLLPLRRRAAEFADLPPDALVQALVVLYDPGAGIGWHRDRPVFEHVVGISLGAPATLRLRRRTESGFERASLPLSPRSIYHLSGEARHQWEHGIAEHDALRWSVTFRSLAERSGTRR